MQLKTFNLLLMHLCIVSLNSFCFALKLSFFKSVSEHNQIFKTFIPVTIQTCRDECERRPRCVAAAYHRRYSMCRLMSRQDTNTSVRGAVMLTGPKVNNPCGELICAINEKCVRNGSDIVCKVTDCLEPERRHLTYFGSVYNVGSHIIYKGRPHGHDLQRTCLITGEWSQYESRITSDCFDVTGPSGVYWQPDLGTAIFCVMDTDKGNGLYFGVTSDCFGVTGPSGVYWQPVLGIAIFCDMDTDGGKWLVFQRRIDGTVEFFRNWTSYEDGFGDLHGEFWMGLKVIQQIVSNRHCELRIDMETFQGEHGYAKYGTFNISGQETNYTLTVSEFTGDRGDSITPRGNGQSFSTYDRDNDIFPYNCAERYKGGWWYASCHYANLNGIYATDGIPTGNAENINWYTWTGAHNISLTKAAMKFRRIL